MYLANMELTEFPELRFQPMLSLSVALFTREFLPFSCILPLLEVFSELAGLSSSPSYFLGPAFFDRLLTCLCHENPSLPPLAQVIYANLILFHEFFDQQDIYFWFNIFPKFELPWARSAVLRQLSFRPIPLDLIPLLVDHALGTLQAEPEGQSLADCCDAIEQCVLQSPEADPPFQELKNLIESAIDFLFNLIRQSGNSDVYRLMEVCLQRGIGGNFFEQTDQLMTLATPLTVARDNEDAEDPNVERCLRLLSVIVCELHIEIPAELLAIAVALAQLGAYPMKHSAVLLVCEQVKRFDVPTEISLDFFEILLELIMVPAMDIIGELLECLFICISRTDFDGFLPFLMNAWEDREGLRDKFDDIAAELGESAADNQVRSLLDDILGQIRRASPRDYEAVYAWEE
jgi:hypothetical protein